MRYRAGLSVRNVPLEEVCLICACSGGFLDVKEEEVVLFEVSVVDKGNVWNTFFES